MNAKPTDFAGFDGPASVLDAQVDAMSQRVSQDRDLRCAKLRSGVAAQARDILRIARKSARASVCEAVARERKLGEQALRESRARDSLEQRQRDQQQTRALLQEMWTAIAGVLESRWADRERRNLWVRSACSQAETLLSDRTWRIAHGAGWAEEELEAMRKLALGDHASGAARVVALICDAEIRAGIRISAEGACLDATLTGLLASRAQVEAEFLSQYLELASAPEPARL